MKSSGLLVFAILALKEVNAFWGTPHVLVARHAQELLEAEDPVAYQAVLDELAPLKADYPDLTYAEGEHPMTESATFADNIKALGYTWQNSWHFSNRPYYDQGNGDFPFIEPEYDIIGALNTLSDWLGNKGTAYESSYYYQTIVSAFFNMDDARSFALRLIIHYVGDIHQPLHSTALVDDNYPYGDAGGNKIPIPNICGASNLHAVWDSLAYVYCAEPNLPANDADWEYYTTLAKDMAVAYPIDPTQIYTYDFTKWADISYNFAVSEVYPSKFHPCNEFVQLWFPTKSSPAPT